MLDDGSEEGQVFSCHGLGYIQHRRLSAVLHATACSGMESLTETVVQVCEPFLEALSIQRYERVCFTAE